MSNQHWHIETDGDGFLWLHFDHQQRSVNVLSLAALQEFDRLLDNLDVKAPGLIIVSDKTSGFIAGADVHGFVAEGIAHDMEQHIAEAHRILQKLEDLPFPTLALIHGFCLGGGLELALACDYRVACDDPNTKIGFPEVQLGIFPGYGGTARILQKVSPLEALPMMLSGRLLDARRAKRMGVIDAAVADRQLKLAAIALLKQQPPAIKPKGWGGLLSVRPLRDLFALVLRHQTSKNVRQTHYPAPFALIDHWQHCGSNKQALLRNEIKRVPELLRGATAQNLLRTFFLKERLKGLGGNSDFSAQHLHVIGAGTMGGDIAAWGALKGLTVTLQDKNIKALARAVARANQLFNRKLKQILPIRAAMDRLIPDPDGYGLAKADVVVEAVFEDLEVKRQIFNYAETTAKPSALLATNTSSIPLQEIAQIMRKPERLLGIHFFNPVAKMPLVEVVHYEQTHPIYIDAAAAWCKQMGKLPLPVKSRPGFLVNRILLPYLLEAIVMKEEGISAAEIDQAAVDFGMPMGPIELADKVGLDICLAVAQQLSKHFWLEIPLVLQKLVAEGRFGVKTGSGFYRYHNGKRVTERANRKASDALAERLINKIIDEAQACMSEGIVEDEDLLDAGVIFATGFAPFRGGPLHYHKQPKPFVKSLKPASRHSLHRPHVVGH